jgi:hypothetical protein
VVDPELVKRTSPDFVQVPPVGTSNVIFCQESIEIPIVGSGKRIGNVVKPEIAVGSRHGKADVPPNRSCRATLPVMV